MSGKQSAKWAFDVHLTAMKLNIKNLYHNYRIMVIVNYVASIVHIF